MIKNYDELRNEIDMLQGNLSRICVTNSIDELERMYEFAKRRLEDVYNYNQTRLNKEL